MKIWVFWETLILKIFWIFSNCFLRRKHYVKSVQIRSLFWSVISRIRTEYGEIRSIWILFTQWNIYNAYTKTLISIYDHQKAKGFMTFLIPTLLPKLLFKSIINVTITFTNFNNITNSFSRLWMILWLWIWSYKASVV